MSKRDEFIKGPNTLRLAQIEQSLERIKDAGLEREAELLKSEIEILREKAGAVYDSAAPVFEANVKWRKQPKNAATVRHQGLEEYKQRLREWAVIKYLQEREEAFKNDRIYRSKREGKNNAADWLKDCYDKDREFEKEPNGKPVDADMGNLFGSPPPPENRSFKPKKNFFYDAIKEKS